MSHGTCGMVGLIAAVSAGAADDLCHGTAHLVEHLVLRRCRDTHAPWSINGLTSGRITMFECVTPAEYRFEAEAALLRALTQPLDATDTEVASELGVVDVESRSERASAAVLGPAEERRGITAVAVRAFHERHYRAAAPHVVAVTARSPAAPAPVPPSELPSPGPASVHVRESHNLTQVVIALEGGDAAAAAVLLDLARRVDTQLPRVLTLPVVPGHRRTRCGPNGTPLTVSVRLTVEPSVTALAVGIAGAENVDTRRRWLTTQLRSGTPTTAYGFADPLLQARWQAFWDLSVTDGWAALDTALASAALAWRRSAQIVADAVNRIEIDARV